MGKRLDDKSRFLAQWRFLHSYFRHLEEIKLKQEKHRSSPLSLQNPLSSFLCGIACSAPPMISW